MTTSRRSIPRPTGSTSTRASKACSSRSSRPYSGAAPTSASGPSPPQRDRSGRDQCPGGCRRDRRRRRRPRRRQLWRRVGLQPRAYPDRHAHRHGARRRRPARCSMTSPATCRTAPAATRCWQRRRRPWPGPARCRTNQHADRLGRSPARRNLQRPQPRSERWRRRHRERPLRRDDIGRPTSTCPTSSYSRRCRTMTAAPIRARVSASVTLQMLSTRSSPRAACAITGRTIPSSSMSQWRRARRQYPRRLPLPRGPGRSGRKLGPHDHRIGRGGTGERSDQPLLRLAPAAGRRLHLQRRVDDGDRQPLHLEGRQRSPGRSGPAVGRGRRGQARHPGRDLVNDYVDGLLSADPEAKIIVAGDLNEFQFEEPLLVLTGRARL